MVPSATTVALAGFLSLAVAMGIGRFARIHDPEGNPIELWEPLG